jgi:formylglycine-generating enzyme required for sulfatase activity
MSEQQKLQETLAAAVFEPRQEVVAETRPKLNPQLFALFLGGLLLTYSLFFLLTARSVTINADAVTPIDVSVGGLTIPFGDRLLIRPGTYSLDVTADGYYPFKGSLDVDTADVQNRSVNLVPLPGTLILETQPAGATVVMGGQTVGTTPLTLEDIAAGEVNFELSAERYLAREEVITVEGRGITQRYSKDLVPGWARASVDTVPEQVEFSADGQSLVKMGGILELMAGSQQLTLSASGYVSQTMDVDAIANTDIDLGTVKLVAAEGILRLSSQPSGVSVTRDGQFVGTTPVDVTMSPNVNHQIVLRRAGYQSSEFQAALEKGSTEQKTIRLKPTLGDVNVQITPANARIAVNGIDKGSGSTTLLLPSVEQTIVISAAGYASVERKVTPRAGLAQRLKIDLLTEEEARKAAIKPKLLTSLGQTLLLIDPLVEPMNEFTLGAPRRDAGRGANEVERPVRLTRALYMAITEVTNAQFRQFTADHDSGQAGGKSLNREHQPAVAVSWQQAVSFCNWLSAREGLDPFYKERDGIIIGFDASSTGYRLPSETEWAFASRVQGEDIWRFAWGDAWPPEDKSANLADGSSGIVTGRILNGYSDGAIVSAEVGKFPANPRGLYDLGGNVSEWVNDVYRIPVPGEAAEENPLGDEQGDNFTIRGASWSLSRLRELRLTYRDYGERGRDDVGFRVARYAE